MQFPLAKITGWFTAGILFAFYTKPNNIPVFIWSGVAVSALAITFAISKKQLVQRMYFGIAAYAVAFLAGAVTLILHSGYADPSNYIYGVKGNERHILEVVLRERPKSTAYRIRYIALVKKMDGTAASGKILVNLDHNDFTENLPTGTILKITAPIVKHSKPKNPEQFDYGKYLENKSILAQVYADAGQVKTGQRMEKDVFYYSDKIRNTIIGNLEKSGFGKQELPVIAALVLGQQQDISSEIIQDYQFAGAVHILSVSGLHVGFLLMFLNFLLNFLPKNNMTSYFKLAIIVLGLWGFAILAGLSPSVIRSVTMFNFVAVGMHLKRKTNIFHTLLVSMLLILLFEPSFLFDVGFQLSYLALFFIIWLQPVFIDFWQPRNKIGNYLWQILTVSFAAQIGTFPLSVYYFHQFPGLFFVTNLVVIPMLTIIMGLGITAMLPAIFGTVPEVLVKPLEIMVRLLNQTIGHIASFEQFIIRDIAFNRWMMLSLYGAIIAGVVWLHRPNFNKTIWALFSIVLFQCCLFGTLWQKETEKEWIVFNAHKSTLIGQRNGSVISAFSDKKTGSDKMLKTYAIANFASTIRHEKLQNVAYFNGSKILIIDSLSIYPDGIKPDILLIRQSPKLNLERLLQTASPKMIIADASNFKSYIKLWKATCLKNKIPFHTTAEMGYFKL